MWQQFEWRYCERNRWFFSVYHVGLGLPMSEQIIIAYKRQKVISVSGSTLEELNHGLITDISLLHPVTHKKTSWKVLFINSLYGQIYWYTWASLFMLWTSKKKKIVPSSLAVLYSLNFKQTYGWKEYSNIPRYLGAECVHMTRFWPLRYPWRWHVQILGIFLKSNFLLTFFPSSC